MRNSSETRLPARDLRKSHLSLLPKGTKDVASGEAVEPPRPAYSGWNSLVADIVIGKWELEYFRLYDAAPEYKSSIAGKYQFKVRDYFDELTVEGETFRWSKYGTLISSPTKSEEEWISWIQRL